MTDLIELKPCPFCGGEAHTYETKTDDGEYCVQTQCKGCGAEVAFWLPWTSGYGQRIAAWNDVEKRWNARALIDTTAERDALREAHERLWDKLGGQCRLEACDIVEALIYTPTPSAPSPEAVARAALEWALEETILWTNEDESLAAILTAAHDPATLAAIIAKAGEQK